MRSQIHVVISLLFDSNRDEGEGHEEDSFERLQLCLDGRGWHWQRRLRSVVSAVKHVRHLFYHVHAHDSTWTSDAEAYFGF